MQGFDQPWWIGGGWAIDLHMGRTSRNHSDLDVCVLLRDSRRLFEAFADWDLGLVVGPEQLEPWQGEPLPESVFCVWGRRTQAAPWSLEFLFERTDGERWVYRRDRRVTQDIDHLGRRTRDEIPFLAPEVVLLYKARHLQPRDLADFEAVQSALTSDSKVWLREALELAHPGHPWIGRLATA
jgi:hypothetical protein